MMKGTEINCLFFYAMWITPLQAPAVSVVPGPIQFSSSVCLILFILFKSLNCNIYRLISQVKTNQLASSNISSYTALRFSCRTLSCMFVVLGIIIYPLQFNHIQCEQSSSASSSIARAFQLLYVISNDVVCLKPWNFLVRRFIPKVSLTSRTNYKILG